MKGRKKTYIAQAPMFEREVNVDWDKTSSTVIEWNRDPHEAGSLAKTSEDLNHPRPRSRSITCQLNRDPVASRSSDQNVTSNKRSITISQSPDLARIAKSSLLVTNLSALRSSSHGS